MPAQLDAFFAQHPPNRGVRNAERRGQRAAIPPGQPRWRGQLQLPQNAQAQVFAVFWFLARPGLIVQPSDASCRKPLAPQTDRVWPDPKFARHFVIALTLQASQNDLGTLNQAGFPGPATGKVDQLSSLFGRTRQRYRDPSHETPHLVRGSWYHTIYRVSTQLSTGSVVGSRRQRRRHDIQGLHHRRIERLEGDGDRLHQTDGNAYTIPFIKVRSLVSYLITTLTIVAGVGSHAPVFPARGRRTPPQ